MGFIEGDGRVRPKDLAKLRRRARNFIDNGIMEKDPSKRPSAKKVTKSKPTSLS